MHRIWNVVLQPILQSLRPREVIEARGDNARVHELLAAHCDAIGASLQSVDEIEDAIGDREAIDVVWVARELSWHSVSGVLERLEEWCAETGRPFPVVILLGARRYRFDVTSNGSRAERTGLATAIEAFLLTRDDPIVFRCIPALDGVGILMRESDCAQGTDLAKTLEDLAFFEDVEREELGRVAVDHEARRQREARLAELEAEREELEVWFEELAGNTRRILNSRRWKMGNALAELRRRVLLKRRSFRSHLESRLTIDQFKAWKSGRIAFPESRRTSVLGMRSPAHQDEEFDLGRAGVSVDVVICVHNALDEVRECVSSVLESVAPENHRLLLVNDGSDPATTYYLRGVAERHRFVTLIHEASEPEGYTRAANRGLRESAADYVILLNSDTVVPPTWIESIVECGESDASIGIVGPLSNAASWQSVPELQIDGRWAVNELPYPESIQESDELVRMLSPRNFPRVPFVNGFCYAIKRKVIQQVGYLDELAFPRGYGEEDDYSFRARDAGFQLAIADHVLVWHKKSKSFGTEARERLAKAGKKALQKKYGVDRLRADADVARHHRALRTIRHRVRKAVESLRFQIREDRTGRGSATEYPLPAPKRTVPGHPLPRVTYVLPTLRIRGGVLSVVQIVNGLCRAGVDAKLVAGSRRNEVDPWQFEREPVVLPPEAGVDAFPESDVIVATHWSTVERVVAAVRAGRAPQAVYHVNDFEPWFFPATDRDSREGVLASYDRIENRIVTSHWLRDRLAESGHEATVVPIGIRLDLFFPRDVRRGPHKRLLAFTRFDSPRRGFVNTIEALRLVREADPEVEIILFGEDLSTFRLPFDASLAGVVGEPERLADLYSSADLFVDLSNFQGSGRPALEAMACGTPCVVTDVGGVNEYARQGENAALVAPGDPDAAAFEIGRVLSDASVAERLRQGGFRTASHFGAHDEVQRLIAYFAALASRAEPASASNA